MVIDLGSFDVLTDVLHDAELAGMRWAGELDRFTLELRCLRRDPSEAAELGPVTLTFDEVSALGVSFEPAESRPSSLQLPAPEAVLATLEDQAARRMFEMWMRLNDREWQEDALSAAGLGWMAGSAKRFTSASNRFVIIIQTWDALGPSGETYLLIAATGVAAGDASGPLAITDWKRQFDAWWKEWSRSEGGDADEPAARVPAAEEPERPDYRPPGDPIVELMSSDAPGELLEPAAAWFESQHREGPGCLGWPYARAIDSWWIDGARAEIVVRGIEHTAPVEGYRAENREALWTLSLRRRIGGWRVGAFSVGAPVYGSGTSIPDSAKPWLRTWRGGRIRKRRTLGEAMRRAFRPVIYLCRMVRG